MPSFRLTLARALLLAATALAVAVVIAGCAGTDPASGDGGGGSGPSGGRGGSTTRDDVASSTGSTGGSGGAAPASNSATTGSGGATSSAVASSSAGSGGNCKTTCGGTECGTMMPDMCGGTIDCGVCGDSTDYCIKYNPPVFRDAVHAGIVLVQSQHPEFFDFSDSAGGDSYRVLDLLGFRGALVSTLVGQGYDTIEDPNSDEELRIRGAADEAENYDLYTSAGYSAYTYTSTCTPANF